MPAMLTQEQMTAVLDEIVEICWFVHEGQEDPFAKLTSANRREVAEMILTSTATRGFICLNDATTAILIWHRRPEGEHHFEVVHLWNKCGKSIAAIHEYFQREGLMECMSPASYE